MLDRQILCSTGAFSHFPGWPELQAALRYGPWLEVDGFELMFDACWYGEIGRIASILKESGLRFPAMHADKQLGILLGQPDKADRDLAVLRMEENCRLANKIGAHLLVLHCWGGADLDLHLERNLEQLSALMDRAQEYEVDLAIETLPCRRLSPLESTQAALAHDQRCRIALDTEFLANHQQLFEVFSAEQIWSDGRVCHVHIKDADGKRFDRNGQRNYLQPGEGEIDFPVFFSALKQRNFTGNISLEAPATGATVADCLEQLRISLAFIRHMMSALAPQSAGTALRAVSSLSFPRPE